MVCFCLRRVVKGKSFLPLFLLAVVLIAISGCSGSSSSSKTPAPANLSYPQATVTVTAGQPVTSATPTVTGTVTTYSISPALPAGLAIDSTTGVISGTPTASSPTTTYTITATNAGGSTTTTVQLTVNAPLPPPSALSYPQATITATVGQAIAADTPTVTGTVSSYTVAPTLPAGLSINATTGAISGTPTAVTAQASYTVTATNASGSTTATLQITVNAPVPAPSALSYPQSTVVAMVNQPVIPDIPAVQGTVTSFTVSPTLPAGLSLDPATGTISGTPTQITAQASYTVTASNAGGSTTSTVSITVNKGYQTLLDLGHGLGVGDMQSIPGRILSHDYTHWVLWDSTSDTKIVDGDQLGLSLTSGSLWPVAIAGSTVAIGHTNGVEVRSATDGHRIAIIASPNFIDSSNGSIKTWWKLSSDGTYLCAGSPTGLNVWSASGQLLFSRSGDYSSGVAFASTNQIQIASGAAGNNVIETISVPGGASSVGPAFSGTFNSWFLDGQRFLTNTGTTVWTYSNASVQQAIVSLPTIQNLVGQGNWISMFSASAPTLQVFAIGANVPSATYDTTHALAVIPSGQTLGILNSDGTGSIVDLSGATPAKTDFTAPIGYPSAYTAISTSQWFIGNRTGVVLDGASLSTTPKYLAVGQAWSIAGSTNRVAVALANGQIDYFGAGTLSLEGSLSFPSSNIALSSDGSVLAAAANSNTFAYQPDRTLKIYSLPAGTLTTSIPYQTGGTNLFDFSLSGSGTVLGQTVGTSNATSLQVGPVGGPATWSSSGTTTTFIKMSPDGTSWAVSAGTSGANSSTTNVFKNGVLATAIQGWLVGWIDNNRLLVNVYGPLTSIGYPYLNAIISDSTGATLATLPLPESKRRIQSLGSELIYSPDRNAIYSLSTGQSVWSGPIGLPIPDTTDRPSNQGGVAGSYVVFAYGSKILVDTH
jgi:hypothetical protein